MMMRRRDGGASQSAMVAYPCALSKVKWDAKSLRTALQIMLIDSCISPIDLMNAYDQDGSHSFSKKETLVMLKKIVNDNNLWDDGGMRELCHEVFKKAGGNSGDRAIDATEFEVWLNVGWLQTMRALRGEALDGPSRRSFLAGTPAAPAPAPLLRRRPPPHRPHNALARHGRVRPPPPL